MPDSTAGVIGQARLIYTMIRVRDLERSIAFYTEKLGMTLFRRQDFTEGRFTLAFVGYGAEADDAVIELTHNWGHHDYELGTGWGHIAIGVPDVYAATASLAEAGVTIVRAAGPLKGDAREDIAFIVDPDGYRIELVSKARSGLNARVCAGFEPLPC